jgi:hypothetical protein
LFERKEHPSDERHSKRMSGSEKAASRRSDRMGHVRRSRKAAIHGSDRISLASEAALHDFRQFGAVSGAFSAFFHRLTKKSD